MKNPWNPFSYAPSQVAKAVYGFFLPAVVALGAAYARAASDSNHPVTKYDYVAAAVAAFVTGGAVFAATNKKENTVKPEGGFGGVLFIIGVVLVIVALLGLFKVLALTLTVCIILAVVGLVLALADGRVR